MTGNKIENISIITFSNHRMQLDNLCYLFTDFDVTVFSSELHYRQMHLENKVYFKRHRWINKKENEKAADFLDRHKNAINASDLILIPTLRTDLEWFISNPLTPPIVFFVHNLNYWMFPEERFGLWKQKNIQAKVKYIIGLPRLRQQERIRHRMLDQMDALNFHDPQMIEKYNRKSNGRDHVITTIPDGLFINENNQGNQHIPASADGTEDVGELLFTVPGTVAPNRKDYVNLLEAFKDGAKSVKCRIQLILLGRLRNNIKYGQKLKRMADGINAASEKLKIIYYDTDQMIPDRIYNRVMAESQVIISGIRPDSTKDFRGYEEIYGETVTSGSSADVIRFAKPGVFPARYKAPPGIRSALDTFSDKTELIEIITRYSNRAYLERKTIAARKCALRFTREKILDQFMQQISELKVPKG